MARAVQPLASADVPPPPSLSWKPADAALVPIAPAMAAFSVKQPTAQDGQGGLRDAIANALVAVLEKNGIRTFQDLASNESLEALSRTVFDALPWTIKTTIVLTVGRVQCERRLYDLMVAARGQLFDPAAPTHDLRQLVQDMIRAQRLEEWLSEAMRSVAGSVGGAASSLMSSVTRGLGGHTGAEVGHAPRMLALEYAPAGGTIRR